MSMHGWETLQGWCFSACGAGRGEAEDTAGAGQSLPSCAACSSARSGCGGSSSHLTWQTGSKGSALAPNHNRLINVFLLLLFQGAKGLSASETNGKRSLWRASLSPPNETTSQRKHSGGEEKAKSNLQTVPSPLPARLRGAGTRGCVSPLPAAAGSRTWPWPALSTRGRSA